MLVVRLLWSMQVRVHFNCSIVFDLFIYFLIPDSMEVEVDFGLKNRQSLKGGDIYERYDETH